jgi:acetoin utilization deacetylase AcuC-like enzyme
LRQTGFVYHDDFLRHHTGPGHPERPERLRHLIAHLKTTAILSDLAAIPACPAEWSWIEAVHPRSYIEHIRGYRSASRKSACNADLYFLDSDTVVSEHSLEVACLAAGSVAAACDAVMNGEIRNAFCAIRPPGHHAERARAMGFCLFNNVAIGARYLQAQHQLKRVCIIDWDVHHGNGTQDIFYRDGSVLYISIHQYPLYPGSGKKSETGEGEGEGATMNFPCPPGCGDKEYLEIFANEIAPAVSRFQPEFLLLSAGFDAHRDDPLANMKVTEAGFAAMTEMALALANQCCGGRLVSVLEGGYSLEALARSVEVHLQKLSK